MSQMGSVWPLKEWLIQIVEEIFLNITFNSVYLQCGISTLPEYRIWIIMNTDRNVPVPSVH